MFLQFQNILTCRIHVTLILIFITNLCPSDSSFPRDRGLFSVSVLSSQISVRRTRTFSQTLHVHVLFYFQLCLDINKEIVFSPLQLKEKSSVTSRRSCATSPWTSNRKWPPPLPQHHLRSPMNCLMVRSSPSVTRDSVAQKLCSSLPSWVWNLAVSMKQYTTQSWSATSTSVRTCTPTLYCLVAPPCTPVLLTECRRKSQLLPHQQSRSRSSLPLRGSTPYGSVAPSSPPCPPSSRCGSPSRSTTSQALALSTVNASKQIDITSIRKTSTSTSKTTTSPSLIVQMYSSSFLSFLRELYKINTGMYIHYVKRLFLYCL